MIALCRINKEGTKKTSSFSLFFSSLLPTTKPGPYKYLYDHYPQNSGVKLLFSRKSSEHTACKQVKNHIVLTFPKSYQNQRIINAEKDFLSSSHGIYCSTSATKLGFEYLHRRKFHSLSGQTLLVFGHPHNIKIFLCSEEMSTV